MHVQKARSRQESLPLPSLEFTVPMADTDYLPGARLLALMAFPPLTTKDTRWQQAERSLARMVWLAREELDPGLLRRFCVVIPEHLTLSPDKARAEAAQIKKQLGARLGAAHVAIPYLQAIEQGDVRRLANLTVTGRILQTLEQEAERVEWLQTLAQLAASRFPEQPKNFENRIVRGSLPVLHLAVATAIEIEISQRTARTLPEAERSALPVDVGGAQISFADILTYPEYAFRIIRRAEAIAGLVEQMKTLRPKMLIRLLAC